jgi:hypothetical protein
LDELGVAAFKDAHKPKLGCALGRDDIGWCDERIDEQDRVGLRLLRIISPCRGLKVFSRQLPLSPVELTDFRVKRMGSQWRPESINQRKDGLEVLYRRQPHGLCTSPTSLAIIVNSVESQRAMELLEIALADSLQRTSSQRLKERRYEPGKRQYDPN